MASRGAVTSAPFRAAEFRDPDPFLRPVYIWIWNDRLTEEAFSRQLSDMKAHGVGGVWPLHEPRNFRPKFMRTSLEPDYLTPAFMRLHRAMVGKARELGMKVWLYDEGGWPSGGACGKVVEENPALAEQWVQREQIAPKAGDVVEVPRECLSAFVYRDGRLTARLKPGARLRVRTPDARVDIYRAARAGSRNLASPPYPDLLNPRSTEAFIRITHEQYRRVMGTSFGGAIPVVFADEARVPNPPWTDGLAEDFRKEMGYDIVRHLPEILNADRASGMRQRIDFYDWWSKRLADAFFGRIQKWCREHRLLFAGHLAGDGDYGTLSPRRCGYGHPLRMLRKMDIPGIDTVWRQIYPAPPRTLRVPWGPSVSCHAINANHHFPKQASSVSHQEGKRWAVTESFAAYGASLTPEETKWILNFQYVRGVNLSIFGSYLLSTRLHFMAHVRPFAGPRNPLWKHLDTLHLYVARLNYLMGLGAPAVETAVYYPLRDIWAGGPDVQTVADSHDRLVKRLLESQCDFDLVDDDVLSRTDTRVADGRLRVGPMRYHTVCVSRSRWMSGKARKKLSQFASNGGKVLWVENAGTVRPADGTATSLRGLAAHIQPVVRLQPENSAVRVCKRSLPNGSLYLVTNEGRCTARCVVSFPESLPGYRLDPETGDCHSLRDAAYSGGTCDWRIRLPFAGSCLIFFTSDGPQAKTRQPATGRPVLLLDKGWTCRKLRAYRIGKRNLEVQTLNETAAPAGLGDWRKAFGKEFSGDVEYRVRFACGKAQAAEARILKLGKVLYACEVILNGEKLARMAWRPFECDVGGRLREGRNDLRVIVTNTLGNQYATSRLSDRWPDSVIGPYHRICLQLEKNNLASGLYGPVQITS